MKYLLLSLFLSLSFMAFSQSEVNSEIHLLSPDHIGNATLNIDDFSSYLSWLEKKVHQQLEKEKGDFEIIISMTLHKDKEATIHIAERGDSPKNIIKKIEKKISEKSPPRTSLVDFSFLSAFKINLGCKNDKETFNPTFIPYTEQQFFKFDELELIQKKEAFEKWILEEVIPVVAFHTAGVDPKFAGVKDVGDLLQNKKFLNKNINTITHPETYYWRAVLEMNVGNQIIPFAKVCMHFANGEFDKGKRLYRLVSMFSNQKTLPAVYASELRRRIQSLDKSISKEIEKGIQFHDAEKYSEAVKHYEKLLEIIPNSAWLKYEHFYSSTVSIRYEEDKGYDAWIKVKDDIYASDPMYHMYIHGKTAKENYEMFLRLSIKELFSSKENLQKDIIKYADIALQLKNYGFAAQMYWLIFSSPYLSEDDYGDRNMLAYFLYCLEQLGEKEMITNFKGDYDKEFKIIEKYLKGQMENHPIYQASENKE